MAVYRFAFLSLSLGMLFGTSTGAQYEFSVAPQEGRYIQQVYPDWSSRLDTARSTFQPVTIDQVVAARSRLDWAMYDLDWSFYLSGEANRTTWKNFLHWDEIVKELDKSKPVVSKPSDTKPAGTPPATKQDDEATEKDRIALITQPDGRKILGFVRYFMRNENGLELASFTRTRAALKDYGQLLLAVQDPQQQASYEAKLKELAAALPKFQTERNVDNALKIGEVVSWLEARRQAPEIVAGLRAKFAQPNMRFFIASHLLAKNVNRVVCEPTPVRDNILGTTVIGNATLNGNLFLRSVRCDTNARLQVVLQGVVQANTNGYQKSVRIQSTSATTVYATKVLDLTPDLLCQYAADAACRTSTTIHDISSSKLPRLIERVAWKKAGEQKGAAEKIASGKAEVRIEKRMNDEATEMVHTNNARLATWRTPLIRVDAVPKVNLSSTKSHVLAHALLAGPGQIAGFDAPPPAQLGCDLTGQVHETLVVSLGQAYLGGLILTDERLAEMVKERTGSVPEELQITPDSDPWSITFADYSPLRVRFEDNRLRIAIRGQKFTRGEGEDETAITDLIDISAVYRVEFTSTGSTLVREGKVEVEYVDRVKLGIRQQTYKTFLTRKFDALFKEKIDGTGFVLQGEMAQFGKVQMKQVSFDKGWATGGFMLVPVQPEIRYDVPMQYSQEFPTASEAGQQEARQQTVVPPAAPPGVVVADNAPQLISIPDISPWTATETTNPAGL